MAGSDEKDAEKRRLRDEVAALAEQVAGLRAELAAAGQHCHGSHQCFALMSHPHCNWGHCWCYTFHGYYPLGAAGGALPPTYTVTTTNMAAGAPVVLSISG